MKNSGKVVLDYGTFSYSIAAIPMGGKESTKPSSTSTVSYVSCNAKGQPGSSGSALKTKISDACGVFSNIQSFRPKTEPAEFIDYPAGSPYGDFVVSWVDGCKLPGGSQGQDPNAPLGHGTCETLLSNLFDVCKCTLPFFVCDADSHFLLYRFCW